MILTRRCVLAGVPVADFWRVLAGRMLYALVPLNEMMKQGGQQMQMGMGQQMGGQQMSSDYTGWCDDKGGNCTTFTGQNEGIQVVDIGYNYPRTTPPGSFNIDTSNSGGPSTNFSY